MGLRIVIPSWRQLAPDLESETGCRYAAFIPLGGRPLYRHIVEQFKNHDPKPVFKLVLRPDAIDINHATYKELNVEVVLINHSNSIAMTVLAGLQGISPGEPALINMADTLVRLDKALELDSVYIDSRSDLYRWTSVQVKQDETLAFPHDRDHEEVVNGKQKVCIGLFSFSDGHRLKAALEAAIALPRAGVDPLFTAIQDYSSHIRMKLTSAAGWFDCGHVDTYYESRLGYQNLRHFNHLRYDSLKGQVTKTSTKVESFRHQVRWYKQVPDELSAFLPRIFESSDGEQPSITMELLSIPTLSDLYVTKRLAPGAWNGVVRTIASIQEKLSRLRFKTSLAPQVSRSVYLDKTRSRLEEFASQNPAAFDYKVITGTRDLRLRVVLEELEQFVQHMGLLNIDALSPIHGDFCFSNLLFDPKARLVKMIDPRGEFGIPGIYGDPRYDLAKLAHSFSGGYDFIISDRFEVKLSTGGQIDFSSEMDSYHQKVTSIFESILLHESGVYREVQAIQALLFLSMLPLHVDTPARQLAMLATGFRLFDRAMQEGRAQ